MPVNTACDAYRAMLPQWERMRDCRSGGDAVKARGEKYLPKLGSHKGPDGTALYEAYKLRALFYNATGRTIDGLSGAIFQKPSVFKVPASIEKHLSDVTLAGVSLGLHALRANREILTTGRDGVLVDMAAEKSTQLRPYWVSYKAEDVINWETECRGGDEVLTLVVLRETYKKRDPKDRWVTTSEEQYRVLSLEQGYCTSTLYRVPDGSSDFMPYAEKGQDPVVIPTRRNKPLDFIPFVFTGPTSVSPEIERPPLIDLADVNLSQYRTSASLENALYWVGMPVLALIGWNADTEVKYGSNAALIIPAGGDGKILQADGEMCGALERAHERKKEQMATLGARLLEGPTAQAETATAVGMRHSGEHATLRTIAETQEQGLKLALQIHAWWVGTEAKPQDVDVTVELNKQFFTMLASPDEIKTAFLLWQGGAITFETLYDRLQKGQWAREGVSAKDEKAGIEQETPDPPDPPADVAPPMPGDPPPAPIHPIPAKAA